MSNFILIVVCFIAGILLRRSKILPENTPGVLNTIIIYISLPALVLIAIRKLSISSSMLLPALMPWVVFGMGLLLFTLLAKFLKLSKSVTAALVLTGALGNTSFLGIPMIQAYYGNEGIPVAILIDQAGSFLVLSTLGIIYAAGMSGGTASFAKVMHKIYTFPPLIAMVAAFMLRGVAIPEAIEGMLHRLSGTLAPLALVSVGYRWHIGKLAQYRRELVLGLGYKMVIAPLLTVAMLAAFSMPEGLPMKITIFEAAMPPMITAAIIASEYNLEPDLAAALVGTGIPLSFFTLAAVHYLLG